MLGICPVMMFQAGTARTVRKTVLGGSLRHIKCTVPTVRGNIELDIRKNNGRLDMKLNVPENTDVEL